MSNHTSAKTRPREPAPAILPTPTGQFAVFVHHRLGGWVDRLVSVEDARPDGRPRLRSLPGHEHWLGEPAIRIWTDRDAAEAFAAELRTKLGKSYDVALIAEVLKPCWEYPKNL